MKHVLDMDIQAWELSAETWISVETKKNQQENVLPVNGKKFKGSKNKM